MSLTDGSTFQGTKICYFVSFLNADDILGFYIPMNDPKRMDFIDCLTYLFHYGGYFGLGHGLRSFELMEELLLASYK